MFGDEIVVTCPPLLQLIEFILIGVELSAEELQLFVTLSSALYPVLLLSYLLEMGETSINH